MFLGSSPSSYVHNYLQYTAGPLASYPHPELAINQNQQINWCGSLLWCATTADLFHQTWYGNRCRPEAESSELDYSFYISTALEWDRQIAHILLTCLAVVMCLKNVSPLSLEFAQLHGIEFTELNSPNWIRTNFTSPALNSPGMKAFAYKMTCSSCSKTNLVTVSTCKYYCY